MKHKKIVIFESIGGSDKGADGHRKDTLPILNSIKNLGWNAEVVKFENDKAEEIFNYVKDNFDAYISRVNPGSLPDNEKIYFSILSKLSEYGLVGMSEPKSMIKFGAKDALVKLAHTSLVPTDTFAYYTIEEFRKHFPRSISHGERVLKQNRGSTGEGIWRVQVEGNLSYQAGDELPLDTPLKLTEAVDNHVEYKPLEEFMDFCEMYIAGENGMLVDMRFMPRIKEGEIRILMVGEEPIFVVHKKPANTEDAFSATLFSGAQYRYDSPEEWKPLMDIFLSQLPKIKEILEEKNTPLIWTADFMLDYHPDGSDKYVLGEINCSCVGFTSHLDMGIQEKVAREAIQRAESK
ncbi:Cj0069 family protein [Riemerella anatipestifer]|nr:Cj0069 family protein [Riemerella anatipestifer]